jgi:hypothetical protein
MVLLQGSPVATKGKARSSTPASAHQPENMAGKWRNDSAASELKLEDDGEKNGEGALLGSFYRWKSPGTP